MKRFTKLLPVLATSACLGLITSSAHADALTLNLVDSWSFSGAFGLAYDGSHLQVGVPYGPITEIDTTTGLPTGVTTANPAGWSALAWSGSQLVAAQGNQVYFFDTGTGANQSTVTLSKSDFLIDGLDVDNGGEIFWSGDVSTVDRFDSSGNLIQDAIPIPPGGGFSGVEFIHDAVLGDILVVVNDAYSPRRLSISDLTGNLLAEATFANSRYEDLAFDGHYLYAADYYGNRIDKYGVDVGGVIIGGGGGGNSVPDGGSSLLLLGGTCVTLLLGLGRRPTQNQLAS